LLRASSAKRIACSVCLSFKTSNQQIKNSDGREAELANAPAIPSKYFDARLDFDDSISEDEILVRRVAAEIAALLGIPVDAVSVNTDAASGRLTITSAYIFLSAKDIARLTNVRG